jgi:hypothetical protein
VAVSLLIGILALTLLALVVFFVSAPLRAGPGSVASGGPGVGEAGGASRRDLEAAREAKYREIRDAELDYRTGKLSAEDYRAIDAELRAEAIEILNSLERADPERGEAAADGGDGGRRAR